MQHSLVVDAYRMKALIDAPEVSGDEAAAAGKHPVVAATASNYQKGPSSSSAFTNLAGPTTTNLVTCFSR